jgi:ATP-dependent RNA helicase RhlE
MTTHTFDELGLDPALVRAVRDEGYDIPTPIQVQAIPHLVTGRDMLGCAQTGTGKTAAFALPLLHRLSKGGRANPRRPKALVLTPTRELAIQIDERMGAYGSHLKLSHAVIFGGVGQEPQVRGLSRGVHVLTATPGRLLDLANQGHVSFDEVEIFVLDEADRMLDMGFIHDVRRIIRALPAKRQNLLFSATMPDDIAKLAGEILVNPLRVEVNPVSSTVDRIEQRVLLVEKADKAKLLGEVLERMSVERALVFTRTKHGANRVAQHLGRIDVQAEAIHGNKSQSARQRALENFRAGRTRVLVATDIAARGIDVEGITHVINFDLPNVPESYVHRIGRTARAGSSGVALSFCEMEERPYLRDIERLIARQVELIEGHPYESPHPLVDGPSASAPRPSEPSRRRPRPQGRPQRPSQPPRQARGRR